MHGLTVAPVGAHAEKLLARGRKRNEDSVVPYGSHGCFAGFSFFCVCIGLFSWRGVSRVAFLVLFSLVRVFFAARDGRD